MPCPWLAWALKIPWKSTVSLKVLENWKKIRISLKSPWIVLKAPWTKITLIIKEKVFCVFFLWCSRHDSSFSVIWSSQGTVPSWGDGIAISSPPPFTYRFEMSVLHFILCQITGKTSPWKTYLGPWKVLDFPSQVLYEIIRSLRATGTRSHLKLQDHILSSHEYLENSSMSVVAPLA